MVHHATRPHPPSLATTKPNLTRLDTTPALADAGAIGANVCAAALVDRLRCGQGREIHASRIAGGLSAIGALCLKQTGLPPHLNPVPAIYKHSSDILDKRKGIEPSELEAYKQAAIADPAKQAWLFQRLYPFMAP